MLKSLVQRFLISVHEKDDPRLNVLEHNFNML